MITIITTIDPYLRGRDRDDDDDDGGFFLFMNGWLYIVQPDLDIENRKVAI